jgi:hypothetical protein
MAKLDLKSPAVVLGVSFLLIFFSVFSQSCGRDRERLTETPILNDKEKREVTFYLDAVASGSTPDMSKVSAKASKFIQFLNDHPVILFSQKTVDAFNSVQTPPKGPITVEMVTAFNTLERVLPILWGYGHTYTALKQTPTRKEFDSSISKLLAGSSYERMCESESLGKKICDKYTPEKRKKDIGCKIYSDGDFVEMNPYPLKPDSPGVKAISDCVYSYYYGDVPLGAIGATAQTAGSSLFTAFFATFGTIGGLIVIALFTKYVLKLW